jgi:hypothetical protein
MNQKTMGKRSSRGVNILECDPAKAHDRGAGCGLHSKWYGLMEVRDPVLCVSWWLDPREWHHGFDKYPFILLNLLLSCVAALQGAILLIAAKRQDQISSELAMHDYNTNLEADENIKSVHQLTKQIHERVGAGASSN